MNNFLSGILLIDHQLRVSRSVYFSVCLLVVFFVVCLLLVYFLAHSLKVISFSFACFLSFLF